MFVTCHQGGRPALRGIHADAIAKMEWEDEWTGNTKRDKAPGDGGRKRGSGYGCYKAATMGIKGEPLISNPALRLP